MNVNQTLNETVKLVGDFIWGWPLIISFIAVGLLATIALYFVQFRYFFRAWKLILFPDKTVVEKKSDDAQMSSLQAFINALGTSTGNGSIAGIGTAIYAGGPGAVFWLLVSGVFAMIIRFAEVFLSTYVIGKHTFRTAKGGPMVYLSIIPGGRYLPYIYTALLLLYGLSSGNAMQANSIAQGIANTWHMSPHIVAIGLTLFVLYVLSGGAQRIIAISDRLVPFKVAVFLVSSVIVLLYHIGEIGDALRLIWKYAFTAYAISGAAIGITVQQAIRNGFARALNAHEAGLGVAGVFYGASTSKYPVKDSIMAMLGAFISTYLVCFLVALCILVSGTWDSGVSGVALTIQAFNTVFGTYGGWVVTFCAASFGLGVMVSFAFVVRECWLTLTNGRWALAISPIFVVITFLGSIARVDLIWNMNDIVNGSMLLMNLYAMVCLLPIMRRSIAAYMKKTN